MAISTLVSRLNAYFIRHGFTSTLHRALVAVRRASFWRRTVLFVCDLYALKSLTSYCDDSVEFAVLTTPTDLNPLDSHRMTEVWNSKLASRRIEERFARGAFLWMIKVEKRLAGYGWTLRGSTIEPHYFPLGSNDVHLFDFYVFPEYRGAGVNPRLVEYILRELALNGRNRAYIETAEWNLPQLSSLSKTPFKRLGIASKCNIMGRTCVCWSSHANPGVTHTQQQHCRGVV